MILRQIPKISLKPQLGLSTNHILYKKGTDGAKLAKLTKTRTPELDEYGEAEMQMESELQTTCEIFEAKNWIFLGISWVALNFRVYFVEKAKSVF